MMIMEKTRVHIIKRESGWAVKKEGNLKASKIFDNKEDAKQHSQVYKLKGHDIIIHKKDGSIERWERADKKAI
ncbi:MAG TPA: DUF2188 domain-containing protein [Prolixibacteraceae bacterium]|nr:DUF2188 domain-containing protein [Prolixibacteraceae bacterium]HPS11929.1 DUF2188 domain-containing protein [Prolixibacteraceae bacterium]